MNKSKKRSLVTAIMAGLVVFSAGAAIAEDHCAQEPKETFTTAIIADYVLGCMSANGNTYESLHKCSCSIDFIKSKMTYDEYVEAQTVMQARRDKGQRGIFYRDSSWAKNRVETLEKVQAESTLRCF